MLYELRILRGGLLLSFLLALLATGCGGSTAASSSSGGGGAASSSESSGGGDPTEGGTRRAARDATCDYGGAAERTCQVGLYCCYGPPDNPGDHGRCLAECPEY